MKHLFTVSMIILSFVSLTKAQFTLTYNDFTTYYSNQHSKTTYEDTVTRQVNIGKPGGGNVWDFTNIGAFKTGSSVNVAASATPYAADFPSANLSFYYKLNNSKGEVSDYYVYANLSNESLLFLGGAMEATYQSFLVKTLMKNTPGNKTTIFPMTYNSQWNDQYTEQSTSTMGSFIISSYTESHTTTNIVDAYGTLKLPGGVSVPALRIKIDDRSVRSTGNIYSRTISYSFLTQTDYTVDIDAADTTSADNGIIAVENLNWTMTTPVGVENHENIPTGYSLSQNYPNPFNPSTIIEFQTPKSGLVSLKAYDVLGKEVAVLFSGNVSAGVHKAYFNGSNLNSGIYFYRLQAEGFTATGKAILMK